MAAASAPDAATAPAAVCGADLDARQRRLLTSRHQRTCAVQPTAHGERFGIFVGLWAPTFFILSDRISEKKA